MPAPTTSTKLSTYVVLSRLHHIGRDWKKGDKQNFHKNEKIQLTDAEAAPLLEFKTIELAK